MDNLDNKYYLDNIKNIKNIKNNIVNYFIDNDIVINDDDEIKIKIKKFLLKYKRTIAMICLIILLIIGYHCDPYSINYNHINYNNNNNNTKQKGGAAAPEAPAAPAVPAAPAPAPAPAPAAPAAPVTKEEKKAAKQAKKDAKKEAKKAAPKYMEKKLASSQAKMSSHKAAVKAKSAEFKKKALSSSTYTAPFKAVGSAFTDNADLIFQVFYSIALFIIICIVTIPALAFIVVGIICYVVLKPKIDAIKAL